MDEFFIYNNAYYRVGVPVITSQNRSLRYGDGFFETMKMVKGKIINREFHFERLFKSLSVLKFDAQKSFNKIFLEKKINDLVKKNKHKNYVRIRLMIFRDSGGIFDIKDVSPSHIIET